MLRFYIILFSCNVFSHTDNKLTILHTNDIHSHYAITNKYGTDCTADQIVKNECWGGLARLKRAIDDERHQHPNFLLLDGGDQFQGTLFYTYYNGNKTAEAMNDIGYDVMTFGNHEFDHGPHELASAISPVKFPIVVANMDASSVPELHKLVKPYVEFPQYKVAVVGYITPTAPTITNLGSVEVIDPVIPVQNAINELRKKGYYRIIGLSHNGYHEDMDVASKTKGLSLIVGGHSHTYLKPKATTDDISGKGLTSGGFYPTPVNNLDNQITYVVQAGCWGRFLGHIDIEFNENGYISDIKGEPIELNLQKQVDQQMENKVSIWRKSFDEYAGQVIGFSELDFNKDKCFERDCDIGNWLTDIILQYRPQSEMAIINSDGIRAGISAGNITVGAIQTMLPFGESIVDIELSGQAIWNLLLASITKIHPINKKSVSSSLQVSGIQIEYNKDQLLSIKVRTPTNQYLPINLHQTYNLSSIGFVANGGDNIIFPVPNNPPPTLQKFDELVMDYIKTNPKINRIPCGPRLINYDLIRNSNNQPRC